MYDFDHKIILNILSKLMSPSSVDFLLKKNGQ